MMLFHVSDDAMPHLLSRSTVPVLSLALLAVSLIALPACNQDPPRSVPDVGSSEPDTGAPDTDDRPDTDTKPDTDTGPDTSPRPLPERPAQLCAGGGVSKNSNYRMYHCVSPLEVGGGDAKNSNYRLQTGTLRVIAPRDR